MRQIILFGQILLISLQCAGCDDPPSKIVGSKLSPDGQHIIWVTEQEGGFVSGLTSIHLSKFDGKPEDTNMIISSPDCEGVRVAWNGNDEVIVSYNDFFGTFNSKLRTLSPKVSIVHNDNLIKSGIKMVNYMEISCDPF